jgi:pyruvate kinase
MRGEAPSAAPGGTGAGPTGNADLLTVQWEGFPNAVHAGDPVFLADGRVRLKVLEVADGTVTLEVEAGGAVSSHQGVNLPGADSDLPDTRVADEPWIDFACENGIDLLAVSFVRRPADLEKVSAHVRERGGDIPLIAKIEKPQAVERADEILRAADCVMIARGDLGIELPIARVPIVQKQLLQLAGWLARPAITATQMLDSMVHTSRPTRAEVADVANAILDGTDAVMLSQETAIGAYAVEAVAMMAAIAEQTEAIAPYERWNDSRVRRTEFDPAHTIAHNLCDAARELRLDALVIPTLSGRSARLVSAHRPTVPIYALSPGRETVRRCALMWGVEAASIPRRETTEELIADAARRVVELGWCKRGQRVGITAGLPSGRPGTTSLIQIQTV